MGFGLLLYGCIPRDSSIVFSCGRNQAEWLSQLEYSKLCRGDDFGKMANIVTDINSVFGNGDIQGFMKSVICGLHW